MSVKHYQHGCNTAQRTLGLCTQVKEAGAWDNFLRRLARGRGLAKPPVTGAGEALPRPSFREWMIGNPEHLVTQPGKLLSNALSLQRAKDSIQAIRGQGPGGSGMWARTKGVGGLSLEAMNKAMILGIPGYGVHQALTTPREPGQTTGERVGKALGEGLGWLPGMGILGTGAVMLTPEYSVPGLVGQAGGLVGRGVSTLLGEKPAPMYPFNHLTGLAPGEMPQEGLSPEGVPQEENYYDPNKQFLDNRRV